MTPITTDAIKAAKALVEQPMRVIVACERSGRVRDAFAARGHDAWSCDLEPSDTPGQHIQGDALEAVYGQSWDLLIAHPPCTYLANSGVQWLWRDRERWRLLEEAVDLFKAFLNAPVPKKATENPIPHKYALELIGEKYSQIIHPFDFGHPEQKATCLWLHGLPPLRGTHDVKAVMQTLPKREQQRIFHMAPGPDRQKLRSVTFSGIAEAMADQWGGLQLMKQAV